MRPAPASLLRLSSQRVLLALLSLGLLFGGGCQEVPADNPFDPETPVAQQEKARTKDEAAMLEKKFKIEIETLNQIIKQNKEYLDVQEQSTRELT